MSNDLTIAEPQSVAELITLADRARDYAAQAKSENTRRAYDADFNAFIGWCRARRLRAMPATMETLAAYLTAHAGVLKVSTLTRRLSAIKEAHRYAGYELDTSAVAFRDLWRGIRKRHGAPARQKAALVTDILRKAIAALPDTLAGKRGRALLLVGFAAALRRSELVALEARPNARLVGFRRQRRGSRCISPAPRRIRRAMGQSSGCPTVPTPRPGPCLSCLARSLGDH